MKNSLILLALFGMIAHTFAVKCYYGWTTDSDTEPEDDWAQTCDKYTDESVDGKGCNAKECTGNNAGCFKARYEGDDGQLSVYGCVNDATSINENNVEIPGGLTVANLALTNLPSEDEECDDKDSFTVPLDDDDTVLDPFSGLGEDPNAQWCFCVDGTCNGAEKISAALAVVLSVAVAAMV